ncbi:PP2C family protein-serine/threonine phosphatase [Anabaenopsis arnoldii]|uniref:Protein phosphatase 2C domain-containing protein n=1 Tax=Anabaenopsis arnoldii TaxID=2152938 RepID=A0ABT5ALV3_9CYAN|nr:protein phosphatase 2C domain-containing protein [Anabaenopsis arnoldii]MDB9538275.1 protein phosphatase 2C domain-containing protein [Anabaenopsis arnoldii]MDH6090540.1 protein phosphatase 2C domain-containing protein [Anabaenopsis arnoldii]
MSSPTIDTSNSLVIQTHSKLTIGDIPVEIISYLGQTADVYYFQVNILPPDDSTTPCEPMKLGLLRVGSLDSGLSRELQLREILGDYKLIAQLLAHSQAASVTINLETTPPPPQETDTVDEGSLITDTQELEGESPAETTSSNYLEEEYYPEVEITSSTEKILLLTDFPDQSQTIETWLTAEHTLEESLFLTTQVCQFFRYIHQRNWCLISLLPPWVQMGTPIKFFDLTTAYPLGVTLPSGLLGDYLAPELGYSQNPIQESMSTYTVGALLYHIIHQHPLPQELSLEFQIKPIPQIYQILKISLAPVAEQRFNLSQLLNVLVETRKSYSTIKTQWQVATGSTVGLSPHRLHNEDNYGVRQEQLSNSQTMILAVVADGMGGMSHGELASKIAVEIPLQTAIPPECKTLEQYQQWLTSLFHTANEAINDQVKDGGTTLSMILAIAQQLIIAHVGDSRIYLLRQGEIRQLSEDHSLVAMLVASGQITLEESIDHPDRNVLIKSIGSKSRLSDGYVQDLRRTTPELSLTLEDADIIILCSDGVWDLVPPSDLADIFNNCHHPDLDLQLAVDKTITQVLQKGASDNATLVALKCTIQKNVASG